MDQVGGSDQEEERIRNNEEEAGEGRKRHF